MEIDLALLADAATVDAAGKLNILGIFDRISARSFPVRHPRLALVLRFRATMNEAGDHAVKILLSGRSRSAWGIRPPGGLSVCPRSSISTGFPSRNLDDMRLTFRSMEITRSPFHSISMTPIPRHRLLRPDAFLSG